MLVGSKTLAAATASLRDFPGLAPGLGNYGFDEVLVDARAAMRHIGYNGRL